MTELLLPLILLVLVVAIVLIIVLLNRFSGLSRVVGGDLRDELRTSREDSRSAAKELREEVTTGLRSTSEMLFTPLDSMGRAQQVALDGMAAKLTELAGANQGALGIIRDTFDVRIKELLESNEAKIAAMRREASEGLQVTREATLLALDASAKTRDQKLEEMTQRLTALTLSNQEALEKVRVTFDERVKELQAGNEKKLDEMRKTVDEKLHETLEKRLGESFKLVSDRLEAVHKGLGEMQVLAAGVGDLKRVLTNVKVRGTWAEVQLGAILEQVLTPEQYERNVQVKPDSGGRVEYAIKLPGPKDDPAACIWLPIDSKFPQEDYLRLQDAAERGDANAVQAASEDLARTIRIAARDICDKYVAPPYTTDFGIMFLATEGLYAEVLRQPSLVDDLQHLHRVVLAGPATLAAILSSLRMGFQTLAIEQRAGEVWRMLGAIKTEFGKFGDALEKVKRQLITASRTIEETGVRSRAIERKLRSVEHLSDAEASAVLALPAGTSDSEPDEYDAEESAHELAPR